MDLKYEAQLEQLAETKKLNDNITILNEKMDKLITNTTKVTP